MMDADGELFEMNLNLEPNEASGLVSIQNEALLREHGWEFGFWAVLDETNAEDCVAVIGHERGADIQEGWKIERLHTTPRFLGSEGETEDAESVARHDGWVYVFGSQHGGKQGPVDLEEAWVARFREGDVDHAFKDPAVEMEIARTDLVLHRVINDAFKEMSLNLLPQGSTIYESFITGSRAEDSPVADLVREDDVTINVEGAAFRDDGSLLLGLRYPLAADGSPVLVDLDGIGRLFEPGGGLPEVRGFWVVDAVGRNGELAGVRDLVLLDDELHLVTGNIDSKQKGSVLLEDHPGGRDTVATHFRCKLPSGERSGYLEAEFVREFPELPRVEGISVTEEGRFFFVTDEDEGVHLRLTQLLGN